MNAVFLPPVEQLETLEQSVLKSLKSGNKLISSNLDSIEPALPPAIHDAVFNYLRQVPQSQFADLVKVNQFRVTVQYQFYKDHILGLSPTHDQMVLPFASMEYHISGTVQSPGVFTVLRSNEPMIVSDKARGISRLAYVELLATPNYFTNDIVVHSIRKLYPVPLFIGDQFQINGPFTSVKLAEDLYHSSILGIGDPVPGSIVLANPKTVVKFQNVERRRINGKWTYKPIDYTSRNSHLLDFLSEEEVGFYYVHKDRSKELMHGKLYASGWVNFQTGSADITVLNGAQL